MLPIIIQTSQQTQQKYLLITPYDYRIKYMFTLDTELNLLRFYWDSSEAVKKLKHDTDILWPFWNGLFIKQN